jgi:hypothetical protein
MAKAKRQRNPNADLVDAFRNNRDRVAEYYDKVGHARPVILLDYQRMRIHAYPYEKCKSMLRKSSQGMMDQVYKRAVAKKRVLVLVWDNATRRLVTTTFHHA